MPRLPPGPGYLAQRLPHLLVPPGAVYLFIKTLQGHVAGTNALPSWALAAFVALAPPTAFIFERYYRRWVVTRAAKALGAEVIPTVEEGWPNILGISIMKAVGDSFNNGFPGEPFIDWMKQYGNIFQLPFITSDSRIITFDPDHIKAFLSTQFDNFDKGPIFRGQMDSLLGTGVFNSDGEMWKFHRSITRPFFTRERISDFDTFDTHSEEALKQAQARLSEGYAIDFQDLSARFTLDSATQFLFGYDVQSLSAGLAYPPTSGKPNLSEFTAHPSNLFVNSFMTGLTLSANRTKLGVHWPLIEFWKNKVEEPRAIVDTFIEPLLKKALRDAEVDQEKRKETNDLGDEDDVTLLQHLLRQTQDVTILKDELLNLLVAARDTTAAMLTFGFYMLTEHPEVENRLRAEIVSKLGYSRQPSYADMKDLKYLRAFINEVLRLYPPVPFDSRVSINETVLHSKTPQGPKKHYVPPHTRVLYSVLFMQRRKDLWGPDADEFDPDRFIDERLQKYLVPNPYIFCPFNAGPRICLGQQFAYHEASFFIIRLLQRFTNFRLAEDAVSEENKPRERWADKGGRLAKEKIRPATHLTLHVKGGLWVRMDELKHDQEKL